jgi:putative transposase
VRVHCYVLVENHLHLVATTPEGNLSKWMHQLKTAYTVYFDRRHQVVGHLFQGRFKSTVIEAEKHLLEVSRYLHLNPVRGMVLGQGTPMERRERLREYHWSSYRGYAGLEKRKSFLDSEPIQGVFQTYTGRRWKAWEYRRWVEEGFLRKLKDQWN